MKILPEEQRIIQATAQSFIKEYRSKVITSLGKERITLSGFLKSQDNDFVELSDRKGIEPEIILRDFTQREILTHSQQVTLSEALNLSFKERQDINDDLEKKLSNAEL